MSNDADAKAEAEAVAQALGARKFPHVLKLSVPVEVGKLTVTELEFRDGRTGDLKGLGTKPGEVPTDDQLIEIAARMCGASLKVMDQLSAEDGAEAKEIALGFWLRCQPSGRTR